MCSSLLAWLVLESTLNMFDMSITMMMMMMMMMMTMMVVVLEGRCVHAFVRACGRADVRTTGVCARLRTGTGA